MRLINVLPNSILLEPFGKNTAPAIALSALMSVEKYSDPILLVLPSDHKIENIETFNNKILEGISLASKDSLVTFELFQKSLKLNMVILSLMKRFQEKLNQAILKNLLRSQEKK